MPVLKSLPPWPSPQESIGGQIVSSRVGRRKVWTARGPACTTFERDIYPEIENHLRGLDLGHSELFIKLYMIGRKPEDANPIIMLCCTNAKARDDAEAVIRDSGLLNQHRGFGLGAAALPLEHQIPVRRLAGGNVGVEGCTMSPSTSDTKCSGNNNDALQKLDNKLVEADEELEEFFLPAPLYQRWPGGRPGPHASSVWIIDALADSESFTSIDPARLVFASSTEPRLGRRIFASSIRGGRKRLNHATAGIVIEADGCYFQLTAGHLFEPHNETFRAEVPASSFDECHFDGQSDEGEYDSGHESEVTDRGSATPEAASSSEGSSSDSTDEQGDESSKTDMSRDTCLRTLKESGLEALPLQTMPKTANIVIEAPFRLHDKVPGFLIGCLSQFPKRSIQSSIDYALITVPHDLVEEISQQIDSQSQRHFLPVEGIAGVGTEACNIIVVTTYGIIHGILLPGKISYRSHHDPQFQRLLQVDLESEVFEGDCGSPVLDESTGNLYGHLIMGVAGTKAAYIVLAIDIFQDIEKKLTSKSVRVVIGQGVGKAEKSAKSSPTRLQVVASTANGKNDKNLKKKFNHLHTSPPLLRGSVTSGPIQVSFDESHSSSSSSVASMSSDQASKSSRSSSTAPQASPYDLYHSTCQAPMLTGLPCEFVGLHDCDLVFGFDDTQRWIDHIITHHLDNRLPSRALCWFCDKKKFDATKTSDRLKSFVERMKHIRGHIKHEGKTLEQIRPDFYMLEHLYGSKLISDQMYHRAKRYTEVVQGNWIIPHDAVPRDMQAKEYEPSDPHVEERNFQRHRKKSGKRSR
ncbi:hypothetical protein F5Y19DRAFT_491731 [Xylariaceae sp. FL1651]|nr:hypothetical protein F5Y19DRAFT_491731 [Xylariaceae sp. FL1651]